MYMKISTLVFRRYSFLNKNYLKLSTSMAFVKIDHLLKKENRSITLYTYNLIQV